jgi:hypothetical protein
MRRMRLLLPVLLLTLIFIGGLLLTSPSQAQNGPTWLSFNGETTPTEPILALLNASSTQVSLSASLPGVNAETVTVDGVAYTRLMADGYGYPAEYGLPELPVLRHEVEIPFGAQVSVEVISAVYADHSLESLDLNTIYPMQPPVPKVDGAADTQPFTINDKFYGQGLLYPSEVVSIGEPYIIRGHRILSVEVWPVAYNPSQSILRLYSQVTFMLAFSGADMSETASLADAYASPAFDPFLSQQVLNYNQGRPIRVNEQVGLIIISADEYADAIQPLVQLRRSRGFDVTLTQTSEIPGGPTKENIKAYLQEAYDTWPVPPSYVLLVGDTDTVPTWNGVASSTATDIYYATMDGGGDWHPDIGRGRFPVRSVEQTTAMVEKYLFYATLNGQEPWLKTASFPASCDGVNHGVAEGTHNYVIDTYTGPGDWSGTFPENPNYGGDQLYCISEGATHQDLIDQFSQGRWAIIYSGHGSLYGWEMGFGPQDIINLPPNSMYPFVASHACLTGDYRQEEEVFGETWVLQHNKGAIVFWGSTNNTFWPEDDVLERAAFDELFVDVSPHADVTAMTYAGLAGVETAYPGSARYYWEEYNLLGDPSFHLFMEPDQPSFTLNLEPTSHEACTAGTVTSNVEIGSIMNYSSTVYLESGESPFNVSASFDPTEAQAPYTSTLTVDVIEGALEGDYSIAITATDYVSQTLNTALDLRINTTVPSTPELLSPEDGAVNQPFTPSFDWSDLPLVGAYNFQLANSPLFETPIVSPTGLTSSDYLLPEPLDGGVCYWWRVQADNACGTGQWTAPFHFSTVNPGVSFFDNMESGDGLWFHDVAQGSDHWVLSTEQSHSPTHAWFVPDDSLVTDSRLWTSQAIQLGSADTLTFWHQYQFEGTNYDGSVLEISTDLGDSWTDLGAYITANGYNGTISSGFSNPLSGRQAWTGDLNEWTEVSVDLSSFTGQQVMIRWRLGCDSSIGDVGWYIDDVQITSPLPPSPAPTLISIAPDSGNNAVPTAVVITGTNFIGSPALLLGDTWLESVTLVTSNTLTAVVPMGIPEGVYDLSIFNGDCQTDTLESAFTVYTSDVPITGLVAINDSPTELGSVTNFTATVETGTNITYTWEFGDDTFGSSQFTTHVYAAAGVYTATVTATNAVSDEYATTEVIILALPLQSIYLPVTYK